MYLKEIQGKEGEFDINFIKDNLSTEGAPLNSKNSNRATEGVLSGRADTRGKKFSKFCTVLLIFISNFKFESCGTKNGSLFFIVSTHVFFSILNIENKFAMCNIERLKC